MSQANKCGAITQSKKPCSRNTIDRKKYCHQHLKLTQLITKTDLNPIRTKLIPDLQNIVNEYLTPYDHYKLHGIIYTKQQYLKYQQEYELKISKEIYQNFESEMYQNFLKNQELVRNDPEYPNLQIFIDHPFIENRELNLMRNNFVKKYQKFIRDIFDKYIILVIKAFHDANIFQIREYYFDLMENNYIRGIQLQNNLQISNLDKPISVECKNYYIGNKDIRIFQLARTKYKYLKDYEYSQMSPLWKTYRNLIKLTAIYRWEITMGTMGFAERVEPE